MVISALVVAATAVRANAPAGRYQVNEDTIYDIKTKLTWQRVHAPGTMTQTNAIAYCQGLNIDGLGWRLPTVKELSTLVDVSLKDPAIDPVFTATPAFYFWSASPVAGPPNQGWTVEFSDGFAGIYSTISVCLVRCVH